MPGQISRHIVGEFRPVFFVSFGFTLFVMSLVNFFQAVDLVLRSVVNGFFVVRYWFLLLAYLFPNGLSLAVLTASIVTFSRLSHDRELLAIRSLGVPLRRVLFPLLATGALLSLFNLALIAFVQPYGRYQARVFRFQARLNPLQGTLRPGAIITDFPGLTIFIPTVGSTRNITVFYRDGDLARMISARRIRFTRQDSAWYLALENGFIQVYNPDEPETRQKLSFQSYLFPLPQPPTDVTSPPPRIREKNSLALAADENPQARLEQKSRLAYAFAPLILLCAGIPLGMAINRTAWGVIAACSVVLGYHFVMTLFQFVAGLNPGLVNLVFLPNLAIFALAAFLVRN